MSLCWCRLVRNYGIRWRVLFFLLARVFPGFFRLFWAFNHKCFTTHTIILKKEKSQGERNCKKQSAKLSTRIEKDHWPRNRCRLGSYLYSNSVQGSTEYLYEKKTTLGNVSMREVGSFWGSTPSKFPFSCWFWPISWWGVKFDPTLVK